MFKFTSIHLHYLQWLLTSLRHEGIESPKWVRDKDSKLFQKLKNRSSQVEFECQQENEKYDDEIAGN